MCVTLTTSKTDRITAEPAIRGRVRLRLGADICVFFSPAEARRAILELSNVLHILGESLESPLAPPHPTEVASLGGSRESSTTKEVHDAVSPR